MSRTRIRLPPRTENELVEMLKKDGGLTYVLRSAAEGTLFVPGSISLHVQDSPNHREEDSITRIVASGLVEYGSGARGIVAFDEEYTPVFEAWSGAEYEKEKDRFSRATTALEAANILERGEGEFLFKPSGERKIFEGMYSPHGGSVYFAFPTPNVPGQTGRVSIHRNDEATLGLYARLHQMAERLRK